MSLLSSRRRSRQSRNRHRLPSSDSMPARLVPTAITGRSTPPTRTTATSHHQSRRLRVRGSSVLGTDRPRPPSRSDRDRLRVRQGRRHPRGGLSLTALFGYWQRQGIAGLFLTGLSFLHTDQGTVESTVRSYRARIVSFQFVANDGFAQYIVQAGTHVAVVDGFTPEGPPVVAGARHSRRPGNSGRPKPPACGAIGAR